MIRFGVNRFLQQRGINVPTGFASKETIVDAEGVQKTRLLLSLGNDISDACIRQDVEPKPSFFEPLISLAAIAAVTEKVRLANESWSFLGDAFNL